MSTPQLLAALRSHYMPPARTGASGGGIFAHEVSVNGTWSGAGNRRCDALYAGFTSTSGRILVGHELKVSRADWRSELDHAGKADAWADACHAWYVVAPSTDVVPAEEVPDGWGLMVLPRTARGRRMRIIVKAATKRDHQPPWWAVRSLMARLDTLARQERDEEVQALVHQQLARERERLDRLSRQRPTLTPAQEERLASLEALEQHLGLRITHWGDYRDLTATPERLTQAVDLLKTLERLDSPAELQHLVDQLAHARDTLEALANDLRNLTGDSTPDTA
ncbi:MAG: hypothetical protein Q4C85_07305 [Actinomyces sp.]|uniref:hypothetical protein n=1 Tax=Actinomyces sp. TaxID=29317 RepID=UPI0026DC1D31|nr:hypothetical protein [Actinomyces sp.]MDO4243550.1 hypothetical protein [Actinomyces sp.]